jgi:hypothetical protein
MEDRAASTIFIKHHVAACMEAILHDINQVRQIFTSFVLSLFIISVRLAIVTPGDSLITGSTQFF